ncbi:MAG: tRNA dihydrouridine synthase DusB [Spirochaetales bacterium]|nr:tRNA dihydrouridine synthase DusB [Spirochaetales bacterium]
MSSLLHPVSIGNVRLDSNLFLAPLAGYTDKVYRSICLSRGAALAYTEMVSCEGVARDSEKTVMLMERGEGEKNLAVQLFMPDADTAKRSLEGVMAYRPAIIDINSGCPVPKVIKTGAGSALLKNPDVIHDIVKTIVDNVDVPVTIKIRTGWDTESINYLRTAEAAFSAGASALCMHARTRSQLYMPYAHWELLKDLKEHFPEKVITGSGDLFTAADGMRMLQETGIDAVAFARGAIGNPFIFEQAKDLLEGREMRTVPTQEKKDMIMRHLKGLVEYLGENTACREMRKHVCAYLKGIPNSARVRQSVTCALTVAEYEEALSQLK